MRVGGTARRGAKFLPKIKFLRGQISPSSLSRDRNLFCVLIGNVYKMVPNISLLIFFACAPVYIFDQVVVAF
jgi:hypothetical protein